MAKQDKPLPKPPNKAFGTKNNFEQESESSSLMADRMAAAMAEGTLDEFIKREMPDNEYAKSLASMMMGMTGMLPGEGAPTTQPPVEQRQQPSGSVPTELVPPATEMSAGVLEEVRKAIDSGDVKCLTELLQQEHRRRTPGSEPGMPEEAVATPSSDQPAIDKDQIDALLQIAKDNSVSLDWLILRAIKVYVQEYQKTGKL
jgi:hypothetical protein